MADPTTAVAKSLGNATAKAVIAAARKQLGRRGSEYGSRFDAPDTERELDESLSVLAGDAATLPGWIGQSLKAVLAQRPVSFAEVEARLFIGNEEVAELAKRAVRKTLRDQDFDEERGLAIVIHKRMFGEEGHYGVRLLEDAVAFATKTLISSLAVNDRVILDILHGEFASLRGAIEQGLAQQTNLKRTIVADCPFNVPSLTREMLPLRGAIDRVMPLLIGDRSVRVAALVGQGGSGKSTAAAMIGAHAEIKEAFPGGIFWATLGQSPDIARVQGVWLELLSERGSAFGSVEAMTAFLQSQLHERRALLIIDDVWSLSDLAPFAVAGPQCKTLLTTRDRSIAMTGKVVEMASLDKEQAVDLLRLRSQGRVTQTDELESVAVAVGGLPLALELAAYQLGIGLPAVELVEALQNEIDLIRSLEMPGAAYETNVEVAKNRSIDACLNLSVNRMPVTLKQQFATLSALRPGTSFGSRAVARLCDLSSSQSGNLLRTLWSMSLLEEAGDCSDVRYTMHSVVRAKARLLLAQSVGDKSEAETVRDVVLGYVRRSNPSYPQAWHLIGDDGHLLSHLVYYLCLAGAEEALTWLLTAQERGRRAASTWHKYRLASAQEELYGIEVREALAYLATNSAKLINGFGGLVQAHLTLASLADMNREIHHGLCMALFETKLWTAGQTALHAQRRFSPGDMAATALKLPEPLRTDTLRAALRLALNRPDPDMAAQLIYAAEIFDGEARRQLAARARELLERGFAARRKGLSARSTGFVRTAIGMGQRLAPDLLGDWPIEEWIDQYLTAIEAEDLQPKVGELVFTDSIEGNRTTELVETLLHIAASSIHDQARRAIDLADKIVNDMFGDSPRYARFRLRLATIRHGDLATLRQHAVAALNYISVEWREDPNLTMLLSEHDGVEGVARLIACNFATDRELFARLKVDQAPSKLLLSFLEECARRNDDSALMPWLRTAYRGSIAHFLDTGSAVSNESQNVALERGRLALIRLLTDTPHMKNRITWQNVEKDVLRIEGDVDRLKLLEILLPHVEEIEAGSAALFCARFTHTISAATVWIAIGARVSQDARPKFLARALPLLLECPPIEALGALSQYIGRYSAEHAVDLARSAAAIAAGIGDGDAVRRAFASSSIALNPDDRQRLLQDSFWYWPDTMPSHEPLPPLARNQTLTVPSFWSPYSDRPFQPKVDNIGAIGDRQFLSLAVGMLSNAPDGASSRAAIATDLADLAREFEFREKRSEAHAIAFAIYRSAQMFR